MNTLTLAWIGLPFFVGFSIYLIPKLDKYLAICGAIASAAYGFQLFAMPSAVTLELLDNFSVTLLVDRLSAYFILTNALVTAAVIIYCWPTDKTAFFYAQILMVHGSLNAAFASSDFISLYVGLEVSGIAAFLTRKQKRLCRLCCQGLWSKREYIPSCAVR